MKRLLILLSVAALAMPVGCCCPTTTRLCPCCPCNWFSRPAPICPPAPVYAAPVAATCPPPCAPVCPSPCAPACPSPCNAVGTVSPMAAPMMQPWAAPQAMPMVTQSQPMFYQSPMPSTCCGSVEPSCGCAQNSCCSTGCEATCGAPFMGTVCYGPFMDCGGCNTCGGCGGCDGGCGSCGGCNSSGGNPPSPERFDPTPAAE